MYMHAADVAVFTRHETMSDDLKIKGPQDRKTINPHQDHEIAYWSEKFGVTKDELLAAVEEVGNKAEDVEKHLDK